MLGLLRQEGCPTCLVNALLRITRLPGTISELNYKDLNNIRYFLHMMIILSRFFMNLTYFL